MMMKIDRGIDLHLQQNPVHFSCPSFHLFIIHIYDITLWRLSWYGEGRMAAQCYQIAAGSAAYLIVVKFVSFALLLALLELHDGSLECMLITQQHLQYVSLPDTSHEIH
eukprot:GHVT01102417.1.p1 GENE.GHVT01102417.1~~GHVT01102417.1.p1  ORF type:complete len:109 (+),score=2.29 GHVT01102417.1:406-732(+)